MIQINNEVQAVKLARSILADIARSNQERYALPGDRIHELKTEIAEGRALFRTRVEAQYHDLFEREVHEWAKHGATPPKPRGKPKRQDDTSKQVKLGVIFFVALMVAFGVAVYVGEHRHTEESDTKKKDTQHQSGASGRMPLVDIPSCQCFGASSQLPIAIDLKGPPSDHSLPWSVQIGRNRSPTKTFPFPDHPDAIVTPNMDTLSPHLAFACDAHVFVLVAGDAATAWSSLDASWVWNQKLPSRLADDPSSRCSALEIDHGVIKVPLASGGKATLSVD